ATRSSSRLAATRLENWPGSSSPRAVAKVNPAVNSRIPPIAIEAIEQASRRARPFSLEKAGGRAGRSGRSAGICEATARVSSGNRRRGIGLSSHSQLFLLVLRDTNETPAVSASRRARDANRRPRRRARRRGGRERTLAAR